MENTLSDLIITIDGPSGSGKSSISQNVAKKIKGRRLDTGGIYRTVAYYLVAKGESLDDHAHLSLLTRDLDIKINNGTQFLLNGEDVSTQIRSPKAGQAASIIAAVPEVRANLLQLQRKLAHPGPTVCEGRDMGTVVFPDAPVKFFLTASPEERAKRRFLQLQEEDLDSAIDFKTILKEQKKRDHRDSTRKTAPLKQPEDAILVDSTNMIKTEVVNFMIEAIMVK
ncbi:MAG: (d)CMP kinase, partial [Deltaproteobacteria bacterium]|nr:(d)CMP kinase [Deltaproteobacteria bacterium]